MKVFTLSFLEAFFSRGFFKDKLKVDFTLYEANVKNAKNVLF